MTQVGSQRHNKKTVLKSHFHGKWLMVLQTSVYLYLPGTFCRSGE